MTTANILMAATALFLATATGCAKSSGESAETGAGRSTQAVTASIAGEPAHTHDGWWCNEHGVPEEDCGQCSAKLAADFQKKGDWCKDHDRPDSQCFACHPELEGKFAAQYEAKLGTKPPKPVE